MKKQILVIFSVLLFGLSAFAKEEGREEHRRDREEWRKEICKETNLSDQQKKKMKEAFFQFREKTIAFRAEKERAVLDYEKLLADPNAEFEAAAAASEKVATAISKMISAKRALDAQIYFQILKAEQREPARKCKKMMHRKWEHKRGKWREEEHDNF